MLMTYSHALCRDQYTPREYNLKTQFLNQVIGRLSLREGPVVRS